MANINKNIIMQAGAAVANATNKAAGISASTPEPGSIISAIQLVNGGRTIGPAALAHFTESVRNKLLSLLVTMEPIQSGAGDPSPDNVRPISGRTGVSVYRTGANGANLNADMWARGNLTGTGQTTSGNYAERSVFISCLPNTIYYLHTSIDFNLKMFGYTTNIGNPSASTIGATVFGKTARITTGASDAYIKCVVWYTDTSRTISYADFSPVVIGTCNTYSVNWTSEAGTVYGGTLDVVTGVLTVDRASVDMGTLTWGKSDSTPSHFYVSSTVSEIPYKYSNSCYMICSNYKYDGPGNSGLGYYGQNGTFRYYYVSSTPTTEREIYIVDEAKASLTATDFKAAMNGVQLVYELATPLTYQLTAQDFITLIGDNYIWSDSGDVTLTE